MKNLMEGSTRRYLFPNELFSEQFTILTPKTTKWIHRQFRWIIPFGRACLIPNLRWIILVVLLLKIYSWYYTSYISEAAASLLDDRLSLHIVPPTQLVSLSSPVRRINHAFCSCVSHMIIGVFL